MQHSLGALGTFLGRFLPTEKENRIHFYALKPAQRPGNLRYTPFHKAGGGPVKNLTFRVRLL